MPIVKTQALGRAFRPIFKRLGCTRAEFAEQAGLHPATVGAMLSLKSIKEASFQKLLTHPALTDREKEVLQEAYLIMVRDRLNIDPHKIIVHRGTVAPIRDIVGDTEIVSTMREISILAGKDEAIRNFVMAFGALITPQANFAEKHQNCCEDQEPEQLD